MLISKTWLQSYFDTELPSVRKISDTLMLHSFEIEDLFEHENGDWVIDIDVLPNRAHDCLSHEGVAKEIAGLLNLDLRKSRFSSFSDYQTLDEKIDVNIENAEQCYRYNAVLVKNITVSESPKWLKKRMDVMGQRSINNLVDATNYIMFDMGQPMHVFDADKISGGITVRNAKLGEKMTTLSGEELELLESDLVITDDKKILALAGIKGGNSAEVDENTKNIIIESANFNPSTARKTARRVKIHTDSSKRFENGITSELSGIALSSMLSLVSEIAHSEKMEISWITNSYKKVESEFILNFSLEHTQRLLGFDILISDISKILNQFNYSFTENNKKFSVNIPFNRMDLRIPEDMIEEIGRLYGYHNIPIKNLDEYNFKAKINNSFYVAQILRNYFIENGFIEIMNYTFVNKGNRELFNPIASDKKALRKNLNIQMADSLKKNAKIADFVGVDQILNFEIDIVHEKIGESLICCFAIDTLSKKSRKKYGNEDTQIEVHLKKIADIFECKKIDFKREGNIISFNLEQFNIKQDSYGDLLTKTTYPSDTAFTGISVYQHMKRDISFWTEKSDLKIFENAIKNSGADFLKKVFLFDEFEKDGRTSYAFSIIFQSNEKTLTDLEVDKGMENITLAVENLGGEIR